MTDETVKPGKSSGLRNSSAVSTPSGSSDRALGMDRDISRRDFLNGVALVAGSLALPETGLAAERDRSATAGAAAAAAVAAEAAPAGASPGEDYPYGCGVPHRSLGSGAGSL